MAWLWQAWLILLGGQRNRHVVLATLLEASLSSRTFVVYVPCVLDLRVAYGLQREGYFRGEGSLRQ